MTQALPTAAGEVPASIERPRPQSLAHFFFALTSMALQGFGGVMVVAQRELVERRGWMTREEFVEEWAVAQIMPGANIVNLTLMMGHRYFGLPGALVGVVGVLAVPLVLVVLLGLLYSHWASLPQVRGALRGMGAVAAGMVCAMGLKLLSTLRKHPLGLGVSLALGAAMFVGIAVLRLPLVAMLLTLGSASCVLTWRRIKP